MSIRCSTGAATVRTLNARRACIFYSTSTNKPWVFAFTDNPLTTAVTSIKAAHIVELRARIDALRRRFGVASFAWTDSTITASVTVVKAIHIQDLRTALNAAYAAASITPPSYTSVSAGTTIAAVHVSELRSALLFLEQYW
jgi:hypothetical protein